MFFLEAFTRKSRVIDLGQAFGFWEERISNQLSVSRYLLSVVTSLLHRATGEDYCFYSPKEPGCARYQKISDKFVQVSPAAYVHDVTLSLQKRSVIYMRLWHSHKINPLCFKLLSMPPCSPLLLLCSLLWHIKVAMMNADTDSHHPI